MSEQASQQPAPVQAGDVSELDTSLVESLFLNEMLALQNPDHIFDLEGLLSPSISPVPAPAPAPMAIHGDINAGGPGSAANPGPSQDVFSGEMSNLSAAHPSMSMSAPVTDPQPQYQSVSVSASDASSALPPLGAPSPRRHPPQSRPAIDAAPTTQVAPSPKPSPNPVPLQPPDVQAQASQLVSQFATLAGKLGIALPPSVLNSLTVAAAANGNASDGPNSGAEAQVTGAVGQGAFAQQLERSARESIAAVAVGRKRGRLGGSGGGSGVASGPRSASPPLAPTSAAPSRRRKKPRLEDCETRLAQLRSENATLKHHLANITNKNRVVDEERAEAEARLGEMVREGASEDRVAPVLAKFSEAYSDYGNRRQEELNFHLDQLEKLAKPTTITKMTLWTMGQSDQFFYKPKRNPIAGILMRELDVTPAQGRKIVERRDRIRAVCENIRHCLVLMGKLNALCRHKQKVFHDRMTKCQEILTPVQVARLLVWVDTNADTLGAVCPGWGSERIQTKRTAP